jgi:hypothetical protein
LSRIPVFRKVESGLLSAWNNLESGDRALGAGRSRTTIDQAADWLAFVMQELGMNLTSE